MICRVCGRQGIALKLCWRHYQQHRRLTLKKERPKKGRPTPLKELAAQYHAAWGRLRDA